MRRKTAVWQGKRILLLFRYSPMFFPTEALAHELLVLLDKKASASVPLHVAAVRWRCPALVATRHVGKLEGDEVTERLRLPAEEKASVSVSACST